MNIRQQRYKKNRFIGMSQYNAARAAGYAHYTAIKANRIEKGVEGCLKDALEQAGLTDTMLVKHAKKGLIAKRVISAVIIKREGDTSKISNTTKVPDWSARHKYFETILKLGGKMLETKIIVDVKAQIIINQLHDLAGSNGQKKGDDGKQVELVTRPGLNIIE
ncbi:hypothetical protein LCGC14_1792320 [marine sediment metagenome]|uniref:Terminase small subunit n=1 Tax=marine sediment metagenome TaxID=412755 RepID=A0A0F9HER5_9ZZZZ|nr:hypothetical protein [Candidatus Scalindua sp.]